MHRSLPILAVTVFLSGCGSTTPPADMPLRSKEYYLANPAEIAPMQNICLEWAGSKLPATAQPAVVGSNCRSAAQAKASIGFNKGLERTYGVKADR